jgi:aryl sulfotransferase
MKKDLEGEMRRIADFLGIEPDESVWPQLVHDATFESMKSEAKQFSDQMAMVFEGGSDRFFFKGTNGRWRDVLTAEDLELYERAVSKLDPELRNWLENGRIRASLSG